MSHSIRMPQGMAFGYWHFPQEKIHDLTFEITIEAGDERRPGRYLQLYQGHIGGIGMYFGFQTDLSRPGCTGQGHGLLFSRWGTRDRADAEPDKGGWIESAGHEGDFVGVRTAFAWRNGAYRCWLLPRRENSSAVWYEFRVEAVSNGAKASAGALRFPFQAGQRPMIHSGGVTWTEVYSDAHSADDVPYTRLDVTRIRANGGTLAPIRCDTAYNEQFLPADSVIQPDGVLSLRSGIGVGRRTPPMQRSFDHAP